MQVRSLTMKWLHSRPIWPWRTIWRSSTGRHADSGPFRRTWGSKDRPANCSGLGASESRSDSCATGALAHGRFAKRAPLSISPADDGFDVHAGVAPRVRSGNGDRTGPGAGSRPLRSGLARSVGPGHPLAWTSSAIVPDGRGVVSWLRVGPMNSRWLGMRRRLPPGTHTGRSVVDHGRGQASRTGVGESLWLFRLL